MVYKQGLNNFWLDLQGRRKRGKRVNFAFGFLIQGFAFLFCLSVS